MQPAADDLFGSWAAEAALHLLGDGPELVNGQQLGPYLIEAQLAKGGMGEVYRALDTRLNRRVAVKTIQRVRSGDRVWEQHFESEARTVASLSHPNICALYDVGEHAGIHYLVMELIEGETLGDRLKRTRLTQNEALTIAIALASALEYAHQRGVIHRDIKPGNLMLTQWGVKLLDFGIAWDGNKPCEVVAAGTRHYQPPEQLTGEPDVRSDVFSFGRILLEMLTGGSSQVPGGTQDSLPADLDSIVRRAIAPVAAERYQSITEAKEALQAALRRRTGRTRLAAMVGAVVVLAAIIGFAATAPWKRGTPNIRSVAVLPLEDASSGRDETYFADQVTDELISRLRKAPELRVLSFDSTVQLRGKEAQPQALARELHVDSIVTGTLDRSSGNVRLNLRITDGTSGSTIARAERWRPMTEATLLWDDAAAVLASGLNAHLPVASEYKAPPSGQKGRRVDPEAWNEYAQGRQLCATIFAGRYDALRPDEASARAVLALERSIHRDPAFAPAYAALAQCLWSRTTVGYEAPARGSPRARNAALRAIMLDSSLGEAHAFLGSVRRDYDWDWDGAGAALRRAIELDPGSAVAHRELGTFLVAMGRFAEGLRHADRAHQLDPGSAANTIFLPWARLAAGDFEQAVRDYRSVITRSPESGPAYAQLAWAYGRLGRRQEAAEAYATARRYFPPESDQVQDAWLMDGLIAERGKQTAIKLAKYWERQKSVRYVDPYNIAAMYVAVGMEPESLTKLEEAFHERSPSIYFLNVDMFFDTVRSHPRYREIARAMNLDAPESIQSPR